MSIFSIIALSVLIGPALASPMLECPESPLFVEAGETTTIPVSLLNADNGISGYNLSLDFASSGTAEILSIDYPSWAEMPMNGATPAANTWIQAVDLKMQMETGESPIPLANITIRGIAGGETELTVEPIIIDDDLGGRYSPDTLLVPVKVVARNTETIAPAPHMNKGTSSSSADTTPQQISKETDTDAPPTVSHLSETKDDETEVVATTSTSSLPKISISVDEQTKTPAEQTPGFGWITFCMSGLFIGAISLVVSRKK